MPGTANKGSMGKGWWVPTTTRSSSDPQALVWRPCLQRHQRGKHSSIFFTPCLSFPTLVRDMPFLWLSSVSELEKTLMEGKMLYTPACREHQAPHNTRPACAFNPQQHREWGCHTIHKTSAQGKTRDFFILELTQGHSLPMALDINHTIACEISVRPLACPGTSLQGWSQGGDMFRGHTPALGTCCDPTAQQGSLLARAALGSGGSGHHTGC